MLNLVELFLGVLDFSGSSLWMGFSKPAKVMRGSNFLKQKNLFADY